MGNKMSPDTRLGLYQSLIFPGVMLSIGAGQFPNIYLKTVGVTVGVLISMTGIHFASYNTPPKTWYIKIKDEPNE